GFRGSTQDVGLFMIEYRTHDQVTIALKLLHLRIGKNLVCHNRKRLVVEPTAPCCRGLLRSTEFNCDPIPVCRLKPGLQTPIKTLTFRTGPFTTDDTDFPDCLTRLQPCRIVQRCSTVLAGRVERATKDRSYAGSL